MGKGPQNLRMNMRNHHPSPIQAEHLLGITQLSLAASYRGNLPEWGACDLQPWDSLSFPATRRCLDLGFGAMGAFEAQKSPNPAAIP